MGGATVSEDKSPGGLCGPLRTRSGAGWQAEGQGFDFDFVLSLSPFDGTVSVCREHTRCHKTPVLGGGLLMTMLPSKRQLQPRQRKKQYCHWRLALITFPSIREAAKPTIQSARASAHHPPRKRRCPACISQQWAEADPPIPPRWPQCAFVFSLPPSSIWVDVSERREISASLSRSHLRPTRDTPCSRLSLGRGVAQKSNPPMLIADRCEDGGGG